MHSFIWALCNIISAFNFSFFLSFQASFYVLFIDSGLGIIGMYMDRYEKYMYILHSKQILDFNSAQ